MLIPFGTDAPVYHFPWATIGLIVATVGVFAYQLTAPYAAWAAWQLHLHGGWHPLQWLTCHFVHYGFVHLIGNMVFLWTFGLIVEGKLGWRRFLLLCAAIAVPGAAVLQVLAAVGGTSSPVAGGASLYVFGLMAVACVWAPLNEVTCLWGFFSFRMLAGTVDLAVWKLAGLYLGLNMILALWQGMRAFGAVGHMVGAALGAVCGSYLLRTGQVDCEDWDAFTLLFGKRGRPFFAIGGMPSAAPRRRPRRHDEPPPPVKTATWSLTGDVPATGRDEPTGHAGPPAAEETSADTGTDGVRPSEGPERPLRLRFREALQAGRWEEAWALYERLRADQPSFRLNASELTRLAEAFYLRKDWTRAIPLMRELIASFPERSDPTRIALADVMLRVFHKPAAARKVLRAVDRDRLPKPLKERFDRLWQVARKKG